MTRTTRMLLPAALAAALILAGCGDSSAPEPAAPPSATSSVPAQAATAERAGPAPAASVANTLPGDHARTRHYRIDIAYPHLPPADDALDRALHAAGDKAKREFMLGLPDPKALPGFADRQMQLKIDFSVAARMPRFVSVREKGMAATGGAHPIPIDGSFVYDVQAQKVIGLDDLFDDPAKARRVLAGFARAALEKKLLAEVPGGSEASPEARREWKRNMREMIEDGTAPTRQNFSEFVVLAGAGDKASGLELIFSPYQVAPYVYGTQTVDVPVDVFAGLLGKDYRNAFDTGDSDRSTPG